LFFFSSRRRHTRSKRDWSSDVCSSDLCWARIRLSRISHEFLPYSSSFRIWSAASSVDPVTAVSAMVAFWRKSLYWMPDANSAPRSEERRVGKEGMSQAARNQLKKETAL